MNEKVKKIIAEVNGRNKGHLFFFPGRPSILRNIIAFLTEMPWFQFLHEPLDFFFILYQGEWQVTSAPVNKVKRNKERLFPAQTSYPLCAIACCWWRLLPERVQVQVSWKNHTARNVVEHPTEHTCGSVPPCPLRPSHTHCALRCQTAKAAELASQVQTPTDDPSREFRFSPWLGWSPPSPSIYISTTPKHLFTSMGPWTLQKIDV